MKLIIQIPCYNESETLEVALNALPKQLNGVDVIETLIIDDGSRDNTSQIARDFGVNHIVRFTKNKGLAKGFVAGLDECLRQGADIIVNTDADNQYNADDIQKLVDPIIEKRADIVIGERPIMNTEHFSLTKKFLQKVGSLVVRLVSGTKILDAPSGFRAIHRDAALKINIFNEYTYTIEMIIQAGKLDLAILSVPIRTNGDLRPSRLVKNIPTYIRNSVFTMVRAFNTYRPMNFFFKLGALPFIAGVILGIRWIVLFMGQPAAHIPSLILAAILLIIGSQIIIFGFIADLISVNRKLLEDIKVVARKVELDNRKL